MRETAYEPSIVYVELILGNHVTNERIRADLSVEQTRTLIDTLREALDGIDSVEFAGLTATVAYEPDHPG